MNLALAAALLLSTAGALHEFTAHTYTNAAGESMQYLLYVPAKQD